MVQRASLGSTAPSRDQAQDPALPVSPNLADDAQFRGGTRRAAEQGGDPGLDLRGPGAVGRRPPAQPPVGFGGPDVARTEPCQRRQANEPE
jgi:hypothetical protein